MIVVYYDIETTGLKLLEDTITVMSVIVEDTSTGTIIEEKTHNFITTEEAGLENDLRRRVYTLFEECDRIVGFNSLNFDLPFLAHWLSPYFGPLVEARWALKMVDFYKTAHDLIHVKVGIAKMCTDNGIAVQKSGTGLLAIQWARERNFAALEQYCMQDVVVLLELTQYARTNIVIARGYHRTKPEQKFFHLDDEMQCIQVDANGNVVHVPPSTASPPTKRARVCGDYSKNLEGMLKGDAPMNSQAFAAASAANVL